MRKLLYLVLIAICEGARIPLGIYHNFPHFKAIYHGHGATSYQNVQIQNHGSVPIPNNYVEHIDDYHSLDHSNHDSISISNNYVSHIHEDHPSEDSTHVSVPIENNYAAHDDQHHLSEHLHSNELHEVKAIMKVPAQYHSVEHYVVSTPAPYTENDYQHLEVESPEAQQYYLYKHQHDYEYH